MSLAPVSSGRSWDLPILKGIEEGIRPHFHWTHWLAMGLALLIAFGASYSSWSNQKHLYEADFDRQASLTLDLISERMVKYEDSLWAGVSAVQAAGGKISQQQWRVFQQHFNITQKYPGIRGIGVIEPVDPLDRERFAAAAPNSPFILATISPCYIPSC